METPMTRKSKVLTTAPPTEKQEQVKLCVWLKKNNIFFYAIPNGGSRNYYEAIALKKSGLLAGVPDLCIPIASRGKHSLYIELKRLSGGKVSPEQKTVLEALNSLGHLAVVCKGFEEAKKAVEEYLGKVPRRTLITEKEAYEQTFAQDVMY